jgi:GcrA cell cycle regulator
MMWTAEKIETVTAHWSKLSAAEIGDMIGVSRNAVIGKAHRLGLPGKLDDAEVRKRLASRKIRFPEYRQKATRFVRIVKAEPEAPHNFLGLEIWDLTASTCRNPRGTGPYLFCGQPVIEGQSFCAHCYRLTHEPPRRRAA